RRAGVDPQRVGRRQVRRSRRRPRGATQASASAARAGERSLHTPNGTLRVLDEGDGHPPRGGLRLTQMAAAPPAPVSSGPPDAPHFAFSVHAAAGAARSGVFTTPHGAVPTPAFMAVGTLATVKTLDPAELRTAGASMILANTYHLHLRPGEDVV